jgi:hypothetical protein
MTPQRRIVPLRIAYGLFKGGAMKTRQGISGISQELSSRCMYPMPIIGWVMRSSLKDYKTRSAPIATAQVFPGHA